MPLNHPKEFVGFNIFTANPDPYLWLVEFMSPTGGTVLDENGNGASMLLTPNTIPVTYNSKTYQPYPMAIGDMQRDINGGVSEIPLIFSNALAQMIRLVEANNYFSDHRVKLTLVHSLLLGNAAANVVIRGKVTNVAATWTAVTILLSSFDNLDFDTPQELITAKCGWTYRGRGCDFTGDTTPTLNFELGTCSKTLTACRVRGQWQVDNGVYPTIQDSQYPLFFGGFPGLLVGSFA